MDSQTLINIALSSAFMTLGWFARELWTAVKELKADLAKLREELPREYVVKNDYREDMKEIKVILHQIYNKLDEKADK